MVFRKVTLYGMKTQVIRSSQRSHADNTTVVGQTRDQWSQPSEIGTGQGY